MNCARSPLLLGSCDLFESVGGDFGANWQAVALDLGAEFVSDETELAGGTVGVGYSVM